MQMAGRSDAGEYRYGFNGQETDDEITGSESHVSYKYRIHDARLGRFLSIDPLVAVNPGVSGYSFAANTPIWAFEFEGLLPVTRTFTHLGVTYTFKTNTDTPQEFSISSMTGNKGRKSTTTFSFKSSNGETSLELLKSSHSKELRIGEDVQKLSTTRNNNILLTDLVVSLVEEHTDIGLVVVGNHNVATLEVLEERGQYKPILTNVSADDVQNTQRPGNLYTVDHGAHTVVEDRTRDSDGVWSGERVLYIRLTFFANSVSVQAVSRYDVKEFQYPGVRLKHKGEDAVGVTILFDFTNTTPNPRRFHFELPTFRKPYVHKYKNVRFL
jgi:RHS repeat-associated protein